MFTQLRISGETVPPAYNPAGVPIGAPWRDHEPQGERMRSTLILAALAGVCVAVQTSLTGAAQRTLGPRPWSRSPA